MYQKEFHLDCFTKEYLDSQFPTRRNDPHFQLSQGDVGGTMWAGGDPGEQPSPSYSVIIRASDFPNLALSVLRYLKDTNGRETTYQFRFSERADKSISETERKVLEEIVLLHNDFVTPKSRSG